jgi:hypothetical protein
MGASASLPRLYTSKVTSQEQLTAKTDEVAKMANELFRFMYTQYELKEVWDIAANPEEYIIALSTMIEKQFHVIGFTTDRTTSGEIYFVRKKELDKKMAEKAEQQKKNAKIIAFFFVRVFQILGAMLLIIKDNTLDLTAMKEEYERPILGQALPRTYLKGGASGASVEEVLGPFEFLRRILENVTEEDRRLFSPPISEPSKVYRIRNTNAFFKFTPVRENVADINIDVVNRQMNPEFFVAVKYANRKEVALPFKVMVDSMYPVSFSNRSTDKNTLFNVRFYIPSKSADGRLVRLPDEKKVTIDRVPQKPDSTVISYQVLRQGDIAGIIALNQFKESRDLRYILEKWLFQNAASATGESIELLQRFERTAEPEEEERKFEETDNKLLKTDKITNPSIREGYKTLLNKTMGAHCIKRATQLLDAMSIEKGLHGDSQTHICKFSAPGVTERDTSFDAYKPTNTVAQLFGKVDLLKMDEAMKVISAFIPPQGSDSTTTLSMSDLSDKDPEKAALKDAVKRMQAAFDVLNKGREVSSFRDIKIQKPEECNTSESIEIKNQILLNGLRDVSQQLLGYHVNNIVEITKFLKSIFNISQRGNGSWEVKGINNSVLFAGFPVLDILTDQARELLLKYYSGCEEIYQKGVSLWKDDMTSKMPAAVPMAAPMPAPAPVPADVPPVPEP